MSNLDKKMILFDLGYYLEPYKTLCNSFPGIEAYPQTKFRSEWGPVFHRGRLDKSAKVLIIGQDPAQHETIVRRILVGEAGRRIQGFLAKIGILKSYVMINTFLYSVYGSLNADTRKNPLLVNYRNKWIYSILKNSSIQAVIALGKHATESWEMWQETNNAKKTNPYFIPITHPTQPESSSKGNKEKLIVATRNMLQNWNVALEQLSRVMKEPDEKKQLVLYTDKFGDGDRIRIPEIDFPPGLPIWMKEDDGWARRVGNTFEEKRRNITITIPKKIINI